MNTASKIQFAVKHGPLSANVKSFKLAALPHVSKEKVFPVQTTIASNGRPHTVISSLIK
jgi:hypothetical protein